MTHSGSKNHKKGNIKIKISVPWSLGGKKLLLLSGKKFYPDIIG
jgi:hypothetical protein